jgi:hypothetical protein
MFDRTVRLVAARSICARNGDEFAASGLSKDASPHDVAIEVSTDQGVDRAAEGEEERKGRNGGPGIGGQHDSLPVRSIEERVAGHALSCG